MVTVGNGMTEKALIVGMAVNEYHQLARTTERFRRTATDATNTDGSRTAVGDTVAHHTTRGDKQTWDLLQQCA